MQQLPVDYFKNDGRSWKKWQWLYIHAYTSHTHTQSGVSLLAYLPSALMLYDFFPTLLYRGLPVMSAYPKYLWWKQLSQSQVANT